MFPMPHVGHLIFDIGQFLALICASCQEVILTPITAPEVQNSEQEEKRDEEEEGEEEKK